MTERDEMVEAYAVWHPYKYKLAVVCAYISVYSHWSTWVKQFKIWELRINNAYLSWKLRQLK